MSKTVIAIALLALPLSAWTFAYFMTEYEMRKIRAAAVEYMKESYECEKHLEDYDEPTLYGLAMLLRVR